MTGLSLVSPNEPLPTLPRAQRGRQVTRPLGESPSDQHFAKIPGITHERTKLVVTPDDDLRNVEMIIPDPNPNIGVLRQSSNPLQQLIPHHREVILS
jgi:hypothetical protein